MQPRTMFRFHNVENPQHKRAKSANGCKKKRDKKRKNKNIRYYSPSSMYPNPNANANANACHSSSQLISIQEHDNHHHVQNEIPLNPISTSTSTSTSTSNRNLNSNSNPNSLPNKLSIIPHDSHEYYHHFPHYSHCFSHNQQQIQQQHPQYQTDQYFCNQMNRFSHLQHCHSSRYNNITNNHHNNEGKYIQSSHHHNHMSNDDRNFFDTTTDTTTTNSTTTTTTATTATMDNELVLLDFDENTIKSEGFSPSISSKEDDSDFGISEFSDHEEDSVHDIAIQSRCKSTATCTEDMPRNNEPSLAIRSCERDVHQSTGGAESSLTRESNISRQCGSVSSYAWMNKKSGRPKKKLTKSSMPEMNTESPLSIFTSPQDSLCSSDKILPSPTSSNPLQFVIDSRTSQINSSSPAMPSDPTLPPLPPSSSSSSSSSPEQQQQEEQQQEEQFQQQSQQQNYQQQNYQQQNYQHYNFTEQYQDTESYKIQNGSYINKNYMFNNLNDADGNEEINLSYSFASKQQSFDMWDGSFIQYGGDVYILKSENLCDLVRKR